MKTSANFVIIGATMADHQVRRDMRAVVTDDVTVAFIGQHPPARRIKARCNPDHRGPRG